MGGEGGSAWQGEEVIWVGPTPCKSASVKRTPKTQADPDRFLLSLIYGLRKGGLSTSRVGSRFSGVLYPCPLSRTEGSRGQTYRENSLMFEPLIVIFKKCPRGYVSQTKINSTLGMLYNP